MTIKGQASNWYGFPASLNTVLNIDSTYYEKKPKKKKKGGKMRSEYIAKMINLLLGSDAIRTTKYFSDKLVFRVKRKLYRKRISKQGDVELIVKIGKPNYKERQYIKACRKAKMFFPLQKLQIKYERGR